MSTGQGRPGLRPHIPFLQRRVGRFVIAAAVGLVAALFTPAITDHPGARALLAMDAFYIAYLAVILRMAHFGPDDLRLHGHDEEGAVLIAVLAAIAFLISMGAILNVLARPDSGLQEAILGLMAVPLGWAMVHTLAAFHYAHLYYRPAETPQPGPGLVFPGTAEPAAVDFLYFAFCLGVAAQVSDVTTSTTHMRRVVLIHSISAFFANTVILALAVNAAATIKL